MSKTVNWGIMATGKIANTFAKAVKFAEGANLYACASRSAEKAAGFGKLYGAEKSYGSYEELAADPNVDIVYVASPMSCHYENVKLCFKYGKNVLCEKSITVNTAQLEELISEAREKNLFFMEAMWMKFLPSFLKAREWFSQDRIGQIKAIRADFSNPVEYDPNDRLFRADLGGGALLDLGVYPLTLTSSFLGCEPKRILSEVNVSHGVDMDEAVILKYENSYASMVAGFDIENDNRAVIVGTEGRIAFDPWYFCTDTVRLYSVDGKLTEESITPHLCNGYEYEILEAQRCLAENLKESPLNPLSDTLGVMRLMDRIRAEGNFPI